MGVPNAKKKLIDKMIHHTSNSQLMYKNKLENQTEKKKFATSSGSLDYEVLLNRHYLANKFLNVGFNSKVK
jgi:hypothetical protein